MAFHCNVSAAATHAIDAVIPWGVCRVIGIVVHLWLTSRVENILCLGKVKLFDQVQSPISDINHTALVF
jgi:hypothetical protein